MGVVGNSTEFVLCGHARDDRGSHLRSGTHPTNESSDYDNFRSGDHDVDRLAPQPADLEVAVAAAWWS